jgi:hypothetical protein
MTRYAIALTLVIALVASVVAPAFARDDGRYADSPLKPWFDSLKSGKGACCSDADGSVVKDADWDVEDGHYRVRIEGEWWPVPKDAVLTQPNLYGRTMVWPNVSRGIDSKITKMDIRCFMPGSMG